MIYLKAFKLSEKKVNNPNIYPYNVFKGKSPDVFIFNKITVLYGDNGCGKSTVLNIIAHKLNIKGKERDKTPIPQNACNPLYFEEYAEDCGFTLGENEFEKPIYNIPNGSRYFKSEEILYEVRKIQQDAVLLESMYVEQQKLGVNMSEKDFEKRFAIIQFAQDKFSNGETTMSFLENHLSPNALYLLDEPEVSLSPQNQVKLAQIINGAARLFNNQFIIATHSPFMLGILDAKFYDLNTPNYDVKRWTELDNVRYFYDFFIKRKKEFEER